MSAKLTQWYDSAKAGEDGSERFCDIKYLEKNNISREQFIAIRYDADMVAKSGFLGLGGTTYKYKGETVAEADLGNFVNGESGETYKDLVENNAAYKKYVAAGINNYTSDQIFENITKTSQGQ